MYQNASVFQRKKVIFNIGKGKNIISEFNFNTTILYLKIFIRDRLNLSSFDLLFNSIPIKSNSLPLYKFFTDLNKKSIKFVVKKKKNSGKILNIKLYQEEYLTVKEKNKKLMNNIKTYKNNINKSITKENKNVQRYKSLENLLLRQNEEINKLKKEIDEANNRYIKLKQKKLRLKFIESNNNFSIISNSIPKMPKCLSVESFNTMYLNNSKNTNTYYNYNTQYNTNNNIYINTIKEKSSLELMKDLSSIDNNSKINYNYNETNNLNINLNINDNSLYNSESNPNTNRLNHELNNIFKENEKLSRNENIKKKELIQPKNYNSENKNVVIKYRYMMKEYNVNELKQVFENRNKSGNNINNKNEIEISEPKEEKEEDKINFYEMLDKYQLNNDVNEKIKLNVNNIIDSNNNKINKCFISIFKYLNSKEIYSFSLTNKSTGVCSLYFLLNVLLNKINYLNSNYSSLKSQYEELFSEINKSETKSHIILSHNSKSGLRILNSPHYLSIFNNPIEYFTKNKIYMFIYKMLFQFMIEKINTDNDNDFISSMLEEIKNKTEKKKSIRDFIYNIIDKNLDLSFDNILQCKKIMKQYDINDMESNTLGNMDRLTTIISHVIKDIMEFTGLIKSSEKKKKGFGVFVNKDKNKEEKNNINNALKNKILLSCELIGNEIDKYDNKCKKIEEIISKYYQ